MKPRIVHYQGHWTVAPCAVQAPRGVTITGPTRFTLWPSLSQHPPGSHIVMARGRGLGTGADAASTRGSGTDSTAGGVTTTTPPAPGKVICTGCAAAPIERAARKQARESAANERMDVGVGIGPAVLPGLVRHRIGRIRG